MGLHGGHTRQYIFAFLTRTPDTLRHAANGRISAVGEHSVGPPASGRCSGEQRAGQAGRARISWRCNRPCWCALPVP